MTDGKSLAELRRDIDRIDDSIQELLWQRTDVVEEVRAYKHKRQVYRRGGFFRPSREIEILRRLLRRHHGHFPEKGIIQIWRTIIASHLAGQEHFSLAVYRPKSKDPCLDLAREHYGAIVPTTYAVSITTVLGKVADRTVSAGVVPVPRKKDDAWWRHLAGRFDGLQIVAGLPFVDFEKDTGDVQAVIVAPMAPEPSSEDRSFIVIESERGIGPTRLAAAFAREKIAGRAFHGWRSQTGRRRSFALVEVGGFFDGADPVLARIRQHLGAAVLGVRVLGSYAVPLSGMKPKKSRKSSRGRT